MKTRTLLPGLIGLVVAGCGTPANDPVAERQDREEQIKRCQALKAEMIELQDKPMRKQSVELEYQENCLNNPRIKPK